MNNHDDPRDLSRDEEEFFAAIDRNTMAEQAVHNALADIDDEQYYTLFTIRVEHVCGPAELQVFPERAGTLYRCLNCGTAGIIGG
ncbi:MAG: hypothetical protein ACKV2V_00165 [Blastocatellia bacterium]